MAGRFGIPTQRRSLLARARLTDALHSGVGNGLIFVQARAGFGKTALLATFADEIRDAFAVRWLSLDPSGNSPEVLAEQLSATLNGETNSRPPATAARLDDLKAYVSLAMARASAASDLPLLVVLDNAHELRDAPDSLELVAWLLESAPEGTEVILAGRQALSLPRVDERIIVGDCLMLGAEDLAFTAAEVASLREGVNAAPPPEDVLAATGGWPVGVMAILAGSVTLSGRKRRPAGAAWQRYLTAEVWRTVPAAIQPALLRLSVLPVITPALADLLVGRHGWRSVSTWLEQRDFLFESLPNGGIRLNELVRQYLLAEFESAAPDDFLATIERVLCRLEEEGAVADAIELARTGDAHAALAGLLERHGQRLIHQGAFGLLSRGFSVLSEMRVRGRPVLWSLHSRVLAHVGNPHQALTIASEILASSEVTGPARLHALLARVRAYRQLGRTDQLTEMFKEVRSVADCEDPSVAGELSFHEADLELVITRNFARAERLLLSSIEHYRAANAPTLELLARSTLGQLFVLQGNGPGAVNELLKAASGWRATRGTANLGWVLNNLGMGHLLVGDFESAVSALKEAVREGELCNNIRTKAYAIGSLGDAQIALGQFAAAKVHYEEAIRLCAEEVLDESLAALCVAGLAGAELGLGNNQEADFLARRALLIAQAMDNPFELGACHLQLALVDSALGQHNAAIAGASEAVTLFEQIGAAASFQFALFRLAQCYFRANRRSESASALEQLEASLTEAWMTGALLPVLKDQPLFAQWAASRMKSPPFRAFVARVLAPEQAPAAGSSTPPAAFPSVAARSLGEIAVTVDGREVTDDAWSSLRAKEMFFLFLAHRNGLRKEEAVEHLYPGLSAEKCNSAFHSNLYRLRRALYQESVTRRGGAYTLNAEGEFVWDVDQFESALSRAASLPAGSPERAQNYRQALELYRGPFAEAFFSEWANAARERLEQHALQALSTLAGYHAGRADFDAAADCMERILVRDRFNEEAAFELAQYQVAAGRPLVALRIIDDYRRTYEEELGESLPERFVHLRSRIAAGASA